MDENKELNEVDEAVEQVDTAQMTTEEIKEAVNKTLEKVRNDAMILGYRVACQTIVQMLAPSLQPNCSKREHERTAKKVVEFCSKALKQPEKQEDEVTVTVQN